MTQVHVKELEPAALRKECDPDSLHFKTTDDVDTAQETIGQARAIDAIDFGLHIKKDGFNLYIAGSPGTGRRSTVLDSVRKVAATEPVPEDICYLYNFNNADEPKGVKLPHGVGCQFRKDVENLIKDLDDQIKETLTSEQYENHVKTIQEEFENKKESMQAEVEDFAKDKDMGIQQAFNQLLVVPVMSDHPMTVEEYENLPEEKKDEINRNKKDVYQKLSALSSKISGLQRDYKHRIQETDKQVVFISIGNLIDELKNKYKEYSSITGHLDDVQKDLLENIDVFKKDESPQPFQLLASKPSKDDILSKYRVNLIVDNCNTQGAPVVFEQNPTYYNLSGHIEYRARMGVLTTDFSRIKAGSIHQANGGYLVIEAQQLLRDFYSWDSLKKAIKYKMVKIEDIHQRYGFAPTNGLKPEPIPIDLKVIIVGSPYLYYALRYYDEDFDELFKVKADFEVSTKRNDEVIHQYTHFIANKAHEENLLPFSNNAVARIIEYGSRLVSHKNKLSARLLDVIDIMRASDYWAQQDSAGVVEEKHVDKALEDRIYRFNLLEQKVHEMIEENTIMINIAGEKIGEINGLSVIDLGDYSFGTPSKITVNTYLGKGNVFNIEREVKMSGKIHSKGVMILNGYLNSKFAQDKPLAVSASIVFEQLYNEVEGDSASSAELYCLLSSLGGFPLRQDIAVTGSVNQKGEIQPIGGVNEKIEGFYKICTIKGLTGSQGVIIPEENVKNLMLNNEVVQAVRDGKFHIFPIKTIDEGVEILSGKEAGKPREDGAYPEGSVNYLVNSKLLSYAELAMRFARGKEESS